MISFHILAMIALSTLHAEDFAPAEREMFNLINSERAAVGRPLLKANPGLAAAARLHSFQMIQKGFFSHFGPEGKGPGDRVRKARVPASEVKEHLVTEVSAQAAHRKLTESGKYLPSITDRKYTECGVGLAQQPDGKMVFTVLLITPVRKVDRHEEGRALLRAVNAERRKKKLPELEFRAALSRVALQACKYMNRTGRLNDGGTIQKAMARVNLPYKQYQSTWRITKEPKTILRTKLLLSPRYRQVGLAILQCDAENDFFGKYWVTAVLVEPK